MTFKYICGCEFNVAAAGRALAGAVHGHFYSTSDSSAIYRLRQQKWPITFMAIFDAFRLILALLHIFYLILIGLRILKWGETSL